MSIQFHYFDQFKDMEVSLTPYLDHILKTSNFNYTISNIQNVNVPVKNLFEKVELVNRYKSDILNFESYTIKDSDSPESISYRFYNSLDYWWVFFIFNNIKNFYNDWPWTDEQIQDMATRLYENENKYPLETYYNILFERNENKRQILILKAEYINDVVVEYRRVMNETA